MGIDDAAQTSGLFFHTNLFMEFSVQEAYLESHHSRFRNIAYTGDYGLFSPVWWTFCLWLRVFNEVLAINSGFLSLAYHLLPYPVCSFIQAGVLGHSAWPRRVHP